MNDSKLDAEIKELEELAFGIKDEVEEVDGSAETTDTGATDTTAKSTEVETVSTVETPPTPDKVSERNWESEYKTLRASTDNYKYITRQEMANLKERLVAASREIERLKSSITVPSEDIFKDTFSKEDADTVGEDALQMMQKAATTAADAKTKGIEEELKRERQYRLEADQRSIEDDKTAAIGIFLNKLGSLVPEYEGINLDPNFEKFIKEADPVNGGSRLTHFKNAEKTGNVGVVASYMREFLGTRVPKDTLAERVGPTGTTATDQGTEVKGILIPVSEVDKFYDDVMRGRFKGNKTLQRELETKYDLAFSKGEIDHNR